MKNSWSNLLNEVRFRTCKKYRSFASHRTHVRLHQLSSVWEMTYETTNEIPKNWTVFVVQLRSEPDRFSPEKYCCEWCSRAWYERIFCSEPSGKSEYHRKLLFNVFRAYHWRCWKNQFRRQRLHRPGGDSISLSWNKVWCKFQINGAKAQSFINRCISTTPILLLSPILFYFSHFLPNWN